MANEDGFKIMSKDWKLKRKEFEKQYPKRDRPIYVMNESGIDDLEKRAVLDGISELKKLAGVDMEVKDLDYWRVEEFKYPDGTFRDFFSVDWYLDVGERESQKPGKFNASSMLSALTREPWRNLNEGGTPHYDVLITHRDLYNGTKENNFLIGIASEGIGAIISVERFYNQLPSRKYECIKTETMHELGHVFGLLPDERTENVEESYGKHCTHRCIMRQGLHIPEDWEVFSADRLRYGALCDVCENDLKGWF